VGEYPAGGGAQQAVDENGSGGNEQADGLVSAEMLPLLVAAAFALLLDAEVFKSVIHAAIPLLPLPVGSIAEAGMEQCDANFGQISVGSDTL